jgi:thymidylate kinase
VRPSTLIIITGMSGTGKSSTAQELARQYEANGVPHTWLHEEIPGHPIRDGEFRMASLETEAGMAANVADMYERWERLVEEIEQSGRVYIMEGCLYQSIIRYFFNSCFSHHQIMDYFDRVLAILDRLNPTVVLLYRTDVKASFEKAFAVRGERWKNIILDSEADLYFRARPYEGEASVFAMWQEYQQLADAHFASIRGYKIRLLTADGEWQRHLRHLTEYMGLSYVPRAVPEVHNPWMYAGRYEATVDGQLRTLTFKVKDGALMGELSWWSNMALIPLGNHEFEALSFPIRYSFDPAPPRRTVRVTETYGWGLSGVLLVEQSS